MKTALVGPEGAEGTGIPTDADQGTSLLTPYLWPNAVAYIDFTFRPAPVSPRFGGVGQKTLSPIVDAVAANWVGNWAGDKVSLSISTTFWDTLEVTVSDETASPVLRFTESVSLGQNNRMFQSALEPVATLTNQNDTFSKVMKVTVSEKLKKCANVAEPERSSRCCPELFGVSN